MAGYSNQLGRRWGRGLRPWLLIPKVLCAAIYLGAMLSATALLVVADVKSMPAMVDAAAFVSLYLAVPAAIGAVAFGGALLLLHGGILFRMRWFQIKLGLVMLLVPFTILWSVMLHGQHTSADGFAVSFITKWFGLCVVLACVMIWLGRHKPRLGQSVTTVYQQRRMRSEATS
jgi:hypothetical protein